MKLLIYIPKYTNRIRYLFNFFFKDLLGIAYQLTNDTNEFVHYKGPKLCYATSPIDDAVFIQSKSLLLETGISEQNISFFEHEGEKLFFATSRQSAIPFDVFAASFYLLSRYEEYLPQIRDNHDRFNAKDCLSFQGGFLGRPIIDEWALNIRSILTSRYPDLEFKKRSYQYISTIDIDNAFAYREKGFLRTLGGFIRSAIDRKKDEIKERYNVLTGKSKDPYDTYEYLHRINKKYGVKTIYFFLLGDYGENDKNVPAQSHQLQSIIKSIADFSEVGIHPSYGSNKNKLQLKKEIQRLSGIVHSEIIKSRQHFLKLSFPQTYRNLIENDIKEDYTMGYSSEVGFRAGTCTPFPFYDLDQEVETTLKIIPFGVMEATLRFYMKVKPEEALSYIVPVIKAVKKVDGTFISLWHNESLSENEIWRGWKPLYEKMVEIAHKK